MKIKIRMKWKGEFFHIEINIITKNRITVKEAKQDLN